MQFQRLRIVGFKSFVDAAEVQIEFLDPADDDAPIPVRVRVECAMALVDLVRSGNVDRLKTCAADDCESVYVDFSKNGSKRYCDTGNCGNRMNVIAYRRRKAEESA